MSSKGLMHPSWLCTTVTEKPHVDMSLHQVAQTANAYMIMSCASECPVCPYRRQLSGCWSGRTWRTSVWPGLTTSRKATPALTRCAGATSSCASRAASRRRRCCRPCSPRRLPRPSSGNLSLALMSVCRSTLVPVHAESCPVLLVYQRSQTTLKL